MYKIIQDDFETSELVAKPHYASTANIAQYVTSDLTSRYGPATSTETEGNEFLWDPGGILMMSDEVFRFQLDNITLLCRAQHFEEFVHQVFTSGVRDGGYVKLHGNWTCVCITENEFNKLKTLVDNDELFEKATEAFNKFLEKASTISKAVHGDQPELKIDKTLN